MEQVTTYEKQDELTSKVTTVIERTIPTEELGNEIIDIQRQKQNLIQRNRDLIREYNDLDKREKELRAFMDGKNDMLVIGGNNETSL